MELVNQTQLADLVGVNQSSIAKAVRVGRITYADAARKLFDPAAAVPQFSTNRQRHRTPAPPIAVAAGVQTSALQTDATALLSARRRREEADASRAELQLAALQGELVRVDGVKRAAARAGVEVGVAADALVARLAALLPREHFATIRTEVASFRDSAARAIASGTPAGCDGDG